ncbi:hypothetical protein N9M52_00410 [bacterium]|nr:hypothetical protein [bacterium]
MSVNNIADVLNADTFDTWRTKTNSIITGLGKAVTLGDSETNTGNVVLNGDITLTTGKRIKADILKKTDAGSAITVESDVVLSTGSLDFNVTSGESAIDFKVSNTSKFAIGTSGSHASLRITADDQHIDINATTGDISTSSGLALTNGSLPDTINKQIAHTGTGVSRSSFSECNILNGVINATKLSASGTVNDKSEFAEVDIAAGEIDGTAIGANSASTGSFTSITTTANGNITTNGTGQLRGDVANGSGDVIIDISNKTFTGIIGATSTFEDSVLNSIISAIYPVGTIFTNNTDVNPGSARASGGLGVGTWFPYGEGRVVVSKDKGNVIVSAVSVLDLSLLPLCHARIQTSDSHGLSIGETVRCTSVTGGPTNGNISDVDTIVVKIYDDTTVGIRIPGFVSNSAITGTYTLTGSSKIMRAWCNSDGETGGSKKHILDGAEIPKHHHLLVHNSISSSTDVTTATQTIANLRGVGYGGLTNANFEYDLGATASDNTRADSGRSSEFGGGDPHENAQPYITASVWYRDS